MKFARCTAVVGLMFGWSITALPACDAAGPRSASDAVPPVEVCAAARPGTECELVVADGESPIVSRCHKLDDGSLLCPGNSEH